MRSRETYGPLPAYAYVRGMSSVIHSFSWGDGGADFESGSADDTTVEGAARDVVSASGVVLSAVGALLPLWLANLAFAFDW